MVPCRVCWEQGSLVESRYIFWIGSRYYRNTGFYRYQLIHCTKIKLVINYGNILNSSTKLLNYNVLHIYKLYVNIQDIENVTITFNAITWYLFSGIDPDGLKYDVFLAW